VGIRLRCLSCGHRLELGEAYDDYDGEVRCWTCNGLLEVSLREGRLRSMKLGGAGAPPCGEE
jgi:DNA-directed RNA polymerase subunit N (RpoN/RPB10)